MHLDWSKLPKVHITGSHFSDCPHTSELLLGSYSSKEVNKCFSTPYQATDIIFMALGLLRSCILMSPWWKIQTEHRLTYCQPTSTTSANLLQLKLAHLWLFTSLIHFTLHWCGVWYIPHLTGSKFLYHIGVYCCVAFLLKM